jgi:hypothetical protein
MATHETLYTEPEPYKVPRIRAPWTLKAESYVLFLKLKTLPKGVYSPLEETWADEGLGTFTGGVGMVMIVRYSDTPVGKFRSSWMRFICVPLLHYSYGNTN